jgi:hypothetical protein
MKAKEYLEKQEFNYDHFTKLTSTGISDDIDNIIQFAEDYHQAKLNLLTIPVVSQQRELLKKWWRYFDEESVAVNCNDEEREEVITNFFNCG